MKRIVVLICSVFLGACSTLGVKQNCAKQDLKTMSYFAEGQRLAAFRFVAQARGYQADGILQVKEVAEGAYEVTAFATAGAMRLMTATVDKKGVNFTYVLPLADHAVVRGKVETFLKALLFPPQEIKSCRTDGAVQTVQADGGNYRYPAGQVYPSLLIYKKTLGSVTLAYDQYAPYEQGQVAHYVYYRDGGRVGVELVLVSLKK